MAMSGELQELYKVVIYCMKVKKNAYESAKLFEKYHGESLAPGIEVETLYRKWRYS